jgi:hypothetical protein
MPELANFFGIHIFIFWIDHMLPHIHATYGGSGKHPEFTATYTIADAHVLAGGLPGPQAKKVRKWIMQHQAELRANWEAVRHHRGVRKIR